MSRSIPDFRAALQGSGARPNIFRVLLTFPILAKAGVALVKAPFLCEATSIPADKVGEIELGFMGRKTYYPGDREFDPWTITVINDEDFSVRNAFENWMSALNSHQGNTRDPLASTPAGYTANGSVQQLSKINGPAVKQYVMQGAFPTELGAIELDWGTYNTIEKFQVTLRYQWWDSAALSGGPTTDGPVGPFDVE